jgi:hypothetical protein
VSEALQAAAVEVAQNETDAAASEISAAAAEASADAAAEAAQLAIANANGAASMAALSAAEIIAQHGSRMEALEAGLAECQNTMQSQMAEHRTMLETALTEIRTAGSLSSTPPVVIADDPAVVTGDPEIVTVESNHGDGDVPEPEVHPVPRHRIRRL